MVVPGPGEVQLIDYDPNLPPAPAAPDNPPDPIGDLNEHYKDNQGISSQQDDSPPIKGYIVTLQFRVGSVGPTNAVIACLNGDADELLNIGAELIV